MYPISGINPYMATNSYMMGMMNPYMMMAMQPQNLEQFKNKQSLMTDLQMKQINLMGKVNPFLSTSQKTRMDMSKSLFDYQADISQVYNPYSQGNIANTKKMMDVASDYQMNMMMNPFSLGCGYPVMC